EAGGLCLDGSVPWRDLFFTTGKLWIPNALALLIVAPVLLTWRTSGAIRWELNRLAETIVCALGVILGTMVSVGWWSFVGGQNYPLAYLPYPFLVWAALRFGPRGATTGTLAVSVVALYALVNERGPFVAGREQESLLLIATYLGVIAISNLFFAAIAAEREDAIRGARDNGKRYRAVVEDQSDLICRFGLDGRITFVNQAYCMFHGKTVAQLMGTSFMPSLQNEDREIPLSVFATLTPEQPTLSFDDKLLSAEGKLVWQQCTIHSLFDEAGRPQEFQSVIHDITIRKELEETLREREEFFRLISECMNDMIAVLDRDGQRIYNSPSYQTVLGDPSALVGTNSFMEIHPDDRDSIQRIFEDTVSTGSGQRAAFRFVRKDGTIRFIESQGSVVRDKSGQTNKVVVVSRDITDRLTLETKLRQSQKMEAIGRLAGGIAHDFNNLMQAIIGYTNLLLQRLQPSDTNRDTIVQIEKSADRAAALTAQLLAFSRKQVLKPKVFSLDIAVADVSKLLRRLIGENIQIVSRAGQSAQHVSADPGQIEQVILNLSLNARDAMPQGGTLTIETTCLELLDKPEGFSDDFRPGSYVRLSITDTGLGMTPEVKAHLFEPFFTTKSLGKGTGLGLSIVYGIVRQSGGEISVHSEVGRGTTFHVFLPRVEGVVTDFSPASRHVLSAAMGGSETLFLVEDEEIVRAMLCEVLRAQGYNVVEARHGPEAIELAGQHPGPIDLLISDMLMPEMNGWELAKRMVASHPELPVLYISGYSNEEARHFGKFDGPAEFLQKPFRPDTFLGKVREILDAQKKSA
ncbi:MAG: PAS domain S-box protein, partial [Verrucomicrobiota bacterium]